MITQSQLKVARRCMRKHDYKYNQHLARKVRAAPLLRGSILHEMIQSSVQKEDPKAVLDKYAKKYRTLLREQREEYGDTFIEDISRVFEGYQRANQERPKLKYEYVEEKGDVKLPNGLEFRYIVDKIAVDKDGRRWLMDHKSHKSIPEEKSRFSDIQLVLYYWAWNKEHPDEKVDGVIWDYLRTKPPTVPEVLKNGQLTQRQNIDTDFYTYSMELARLKLDPKPYKELLAKLQARGSSDFFQRVSLPSPSKELVKSVVDDAADTAAYVDRFGQKVKTRNMTRDCHFDCEFYQLCHAELRGLDADFVKKTQYEERDPNARYQEEE